MQKLKSLLIATPTTGGIMKSKTAETLTKLVKVLTKLNIDAKVLVINASDIVTVRNLYANMVFESHKWDALLFIDSDMSFEPAVILRLINLNALVSAAACTKKEMDFDKFASLLANHSDVELARAECVYFNTMLSWGGPRKIRQNGGFITAAAVGMAVCLIKKQALKIMVEEGAVEQRLNVYEGKKQTSWGFFDYTKHQGMTLTEDYAFCYRWTHVLGRPLWVCTDGAVDHIGDFHYGGNYSLVLKDKILPTLLAKPDHDGNAQHGKESSKVATKRRKSSSGT